MRIQAELKQLLEAVESGSVMDGQGKYSRRVDDVFKYLDEKVQRIIEGGKNFNEFEYLHDHIIGDVPSELVDNHIQALMEWHGQCSYYNTHHQIKIPCRTKTPDNHEKKQGKNWGVVQVQTYVLSRIIEDTREESSGMKPGSHERDCLNEILIDNIWRWSNQNFVGGHRCKIPGCVMKNHVTFTSYSINNLNHETCPSYWIINGELRNMCFCPGEDCIRPGSHFCPNKFRKKIL
jgi:hypothetical protein